MIAFPLVLRAGQDLQVRFDVQSTHDTADQRNDVINLVTNTRLVRQARSFCVHRFDRLFICPCWSGVTFGSHSPCYTGVDFILILSGPLLVALSYVCSVIAAPLAHVVGTLKFVPFEPAPSLVWILSVPFVALLIDARFASDGQTVWGRPIHAEEGDRLDAAAGRAPLQSLRSEKPFLCQPDFRPSELSHRAAADSIWASMMRLTSSAIEIPSRFASRIRNFRCGSVNEIICLVMRLNPRIIWVCASLYLDSHLGLGRSDRIKIVASDDIADRSQLTFVAQRKARLTGSFCGFELFVCQSKSRIFHRAMIPLGIQWSLCVV